MLQDLASGFLIRDKIRWCLAPAISGHIGSEFVQGVGLHTVWWQGCHRFAVGYAGGWEGAQHQLLGLALGPTSGGGPSHSVVGPAAAWTFCEGWTLTQQLLERWTLCV